MNIAIASGKGGTGKTTIAMSLAACYSNNSISVAILDCDVEEPNVNLFLDAKIENTEAVDVLIPGMDESRCTGCGECERICAFNAIVLVKGKPLVVPDLCHSCGGCHYVCPEGAITEKNRTVGFIDGGYRDGISYAGGRLNIGEPMSPPVIREVKRRHVESDVRIIDIPPGTSCPAVEAMKGSDYIVLVTEPTPFGLHDLMLAAGAARALGIPFGVAVNRSNIGDGSLMDQYRELGYNVIAHIPHSRNIAEAYSRGDCVSYILYHYREEIEKIAARAEFYNTRNVRA